MAEQEMADQNRPQRYIDGVQNRRRHLIAPSNTRSSISTQMACQTRLTNLTDGSYANVTSGAASGPKRQDGKPR